MVDGFHILDTLAADSISAAVVVVVGGPVN